MAFGKLRTGYKRRKAPSSPPEQHEPTRPRTAPAMSTATATTPTFSTQPLPPLPPLPSQYVDTTTLHSSFAPASARSRGGGSLHRRNFSRPFSLATSEGIHEEVARYSGGGGGDGTSSSSSSSGGGHGHGGHGHAVIHRRRSAAAPLNRYNTSTTNTTLSFDSLSASNSSGSGHGSLGRHASVSEREKELIRGMRDQLTTANSVIRFLHEHVDGMREDRDRYRDRVEELKSLARLTLDMLEGAHRREWEVCRDVRTVKETAAVEAGPGGVVGVAVGGEEAAAAAEGMMARDWEGQQQQQQPQRTMRRRRDSLMRKIGLGGTFKKEGREKEKDRADTMRTIRHDSTRDEPLLQQMFAFPNYPPPSPTIRPGEQFMQPPVSPGDAGVGSSSSTANDSTWRRKRGHKKSHSTTNARLRDDGRLSIPADELERLVQAMDRNVNALREDIKKLVDEVNTHKHHPVYANLMDIPPRFS